ncbi:hypothetical protein M6G53_20465 [Serratia nevei]|uniref:hypothetical protein n=1 Tax=Serratia nevei TaxID=2703794 RepID=UPI00209DB798|nr:hypothetical protein [Serratia nevei]MCP1107748.1 hypothetical protein [Serratia nevei]
MSMRFQGDWIRRSARRVGVCLRLCVLLVAGLVPGLGVAGGYVPSETETGMLQAVIQDDLQAIAEGWENYAATVLKIPMATASEVARAYAEKQATADFRFRSKRVLVSGITASVQGSGPGQALVVFDVPGAILVRAQPRNDAVSRALALRPGELSVFACGVEGERAGAIDFTDCEFGDDFGRRTWETMEAELNAFYQGKPAKAIWAPTLAINLAMRASQMPLNNGCAESLDKCRASSMAVGSLKGEAGDRLLKTTIQRFRDAGLDLSLFTPPPATP